MRIATWNLARPTGGSQPRAIALLDHMRRVDADVWILTETHEELSPGPEYQPVSSSGADRPQAEGERWTMIWSRLPVIRQEETADPVRTACARLEDPGCGAVLVYGTVLPWLGSRWRDVPAADAAAFEAALAAQAADWKRLRREHAADGFCLGGDFNQDLCNRHFYGSRRGRRALRDALDATGLVCVTAHPHDPVRDSTNGARAGIDHICLSDALVGRQRASAKAWPEPSEIGRRLTDHFGVRIELLTDGRAPTSVGPRG